MGLCKTNVFLCFAIFYWTSLAAFHKYLLNEIILILGCVPHSTIMQALAP